MVPLHSNALLVIAAVLTVCSVKADISLSQSIRLPKKECTKTYIGNGAGCICYLFNEEGNYPAEVEPYCKAAYKNPKSLRPSCDGYVVKKKISQPDVEETLMWSVENCLSTPATPPVRLLTHDMSSVDLPLNLPIQSERFFFLPALLPIVGKVVLKASIFAGKQLVRRAATNLATRRGAANAARRALRGIRGLFKRSARKRAQRKFDAAEKLRKKADAAAKAARKRSADVAKKVSDAEKAARAAAKRIVAKAKLQVQKLVKEAEKFARKDARAVADCAKERIEELETGEDVLVEVDAGTVREEVEACLKASKVICVGLVGAEAVRGETEAKSLSFFADLATCLSDNEGVCVAALTAKFIEEELSEREYLADMIDCFPEGEKCGPQVAKLVIGGDITAEGAVEQAIACKNEAEEEEEDNEEKKEGSETADKERLRA